jgi:hypothetical protein
MFGFLSDMGDLARNIAGAILGNVSHAVAVNEGLYRRHQSAQLSLEHRRPRCPDSARYIQEGYPNQRLAIIVLTNLAGANPQRFIPQIAEFYKPLTSTK